MQLQAPIVGGFQEYAPTNSGRLIRLALLYLTNAAVNRVFSQSDDLDQAG